MTGETESFATETITLIGVTLGLEPYTLIRLREAADGSGEPVLRVEAGGGAEDQPLYMPLLAITEHATAGNPVAEMLRDLYRDSTDARTGIEAVTRQFNPEWLPFVRGK